jgi:hypothetical protein
MNSNIKNNLRLVAILAASLTTVFAFQVAEAADAPVLSLTIRCTNSVLKVGDEIPIEFIITNRGTNDYKYNRSVDSSILMPEFELTAKTERGELLPDPRFAVIENGEVFQPIVLHPKESTTRILPLNRWALVKESGRYTATGRFLGSPYTDKQEQPVSSTPIDVTVLPRNEKEMGDYIDDLVRQVAALPPVPTKYQQWSMPDRNTLVKKLMYTCNPRVAAALIESMCIPGNDSLWEAIALLNYVPHTPEIRKAIIEAATEHGATGNMWTILRQYGFSKEEMQPLIKKLLASDNEHDLVVGAGLTKEFGDDAFTARLISIATSLGSNNVRDGAIAALAYHRTDEGVKTLKALMNDPQETILRSLANAIINGYYQGILRPEDITAEDVKPLIERLLSSKDLTSGVTTGINLIEHFGSDDFTARLIALATSSDIIVRHNAISALALNRTDDGLKILKTLLNDPNPKIRSITESCIRSAYTSRGTLRGRLLKPEDFDAKFREAK